MQAASPLDLIDSFISRLTTSLTLASIALLAIAAVGSYVVSGRALRVVENVAEKARMIETSQDLTQRIPEPKTHDEIHNLVRTFNQMLARLQSAFDSQRRFVAELFAMNCALRLRS